VSFYSEKFPSFPRSRLFVGLHRIVAAIALRSRISATFALARSGESAILVALDRARLQRIDWNRSIEFRCEFHCGMVSDFIRFSRRRVGSDLCVSP
jgi:hypothetical protein